MSRFGNQRLHTTQTSVDKMIIYKINVLRDELLSSETANTYDDAVRVLKQCVSAYKEFYKNPRIICNTDSEFELVEGSSHLCIWIEQTDSSSIFEDLDRDLQRFM